MIKKYLTFFTYVLTFSLFTSCNAPRNNPLDPENKKANLTVLEGTVRTVKIPQTAIEDVELFWKNDGRITYSNNKGYFSFSNIQKKNGWLYFKKNEYSTDSAYINFTNQNKITKSIYLNAVPVIQNINFYSSTLNKFPDKQRYSLLVSTKIKDTENDIDTVFIENKELKSKIILLYNPSSREYDKLITLEDLNIASIDEVIGKEFTLNIVDAANKKFEIRKINIKRIVKEEILLTSPVGSDTIRTQTPLFEWKRFIPGFGFYYLVEIYTDEINPNIVYRKEIASDEINYTLERAIPKGEYFWVMWAIDEFGNRTRSKPYSFLII